MTNSFKNGQYQNGNNFLNKFNTLPNSLSHNDVNDKFDDLLKVILFQTKLKMYCYV